MGLARDCPGPKGPEQAAPDQTSPAPKLVEGPAFPVPALASALGARVGRHFPGSEVGQRDVSQGSPEDVLGECWGALHLPGPPRPSPVCPGEGQAPMGSRFDLWLQVCREGIAHRQHDIPRETPGASAQLQASREETTSSCALPVPSQGPGSTRVAPQPSRVRTGLA